MLAEALKTNNSLFFLSLNHNQIGTEGAGLLAEALKTNNSLSSLDLGTNQIGPEGAGLLAEALKTNNTLASLSLSHNQIGPEGVKLLAEALKTNNSLSSLYLGFYQMEDEGVKSLAEALKTNNSLFSLDLGTNQIGPEGTGLLAEALKTNNSLSSLDLGCNKIGTEGVKSLVEALKTNNSLSFLNLRDNKIGDEGTKLLAEVRSYGMTDIDFIDNPNIEYLSHAEIKELISDSGSNLTIISLGNGRILYPRCKPAKSARSSEVEFEVVIPKTNDTNTELIELPKIQNKTTKRPREDQQETTNPKKRAKTEHIETVNIQDLNYPDGQINMTDEKIVLSGNTHLDPTNFDESLERTSIGEYFEEA